MRFHLLRTVSLVIIRVENFFCFRRPGRSPLLRPLTFPKQKGEAGGLQSVAAVADWANTAEIRNVVWL